MNKDNTIERRGWDRSHVGGSFQHRFRTTSVSSRYSHASIKPEDRQKSVSPCLEFHHEDQLLFATWSRPPGEKPSRVPIPQLAFASPLPRLVPTPRAEIHPYCSRVRKAPVLHGEVSVARSSAEQVQP